MALDGVDHITLGRIKGKELRVVSGKVTKGVGMLAWVDR